MHHSKLIVLATAILWPLLLAGEICYQPDNGTGTSDYPPDCPYLNPQDVMQITDGFPPGSGLIMETTWTDFLNVQSQPGGNLGGMMYHFEGNLYWDISGYGTMAGYARSLVIPVACEVHTAPGSPGDPIQIFDQELISLEGDLIGDPDFDQLHVMAGINWDLPSPGETKLTQLPSGDFAVDSFFDITYRIEFVGAPGSMLDGLSGAENGQIQLRTWWDEGPWDFGDAPDSSYLTLLRHDGARHWIEPGYCLGHLIDGEADGQPTADALGDDNNALPDEDGVVFPGNLVQGEDITIDVTATADGFLSLWVDYDIDGGWTSAVEKVFGDLPVVTGSNAITFTVPNSATAGTTFARFRFCCYQGLDYYGPAECGEVEDYQVTIEEQINDWKMHFPQWPDITTTGVDVSCEDPLILADDFRCTESGYITDITIWGSWRYEDMIPDFTWFEIGIWGDNPEGPGGYSQPEELLWQRMFPPGEYMEEPFMQTEGEWWYNPLTGEIQFPGDYTIWQYVFTMDDANAFVQHEGRIYWLSVTAYQPDDPNQSLSIGWKTSLRHWNDDAVWRVTGINWQEMVYPGQHPLEGESMDLAFVIDGHPLPPPVAPEVTITYSTFTLACLLEWDPVPGAVSYTIYTTDEPYASWPTNWTALGTTSGLTYSVPVTGLKKFYRVTANN